MYLKINSKIYAPDTIEEYFRLIESINDFKPVAGGTDLTVKMKEGSEHYKNLILLNRIKELKKIEINKEYIFIGATNTFSELINNSAVKNMTSLFQAFQNIGSPQIRNLATVGGNIVNASPAADSPVPLILYDAIAVVANKNGYREIFIKDFFKDSYKTRLEKNELLTGIKIKKSNFKKDEFIKIGKRKAVVISRINLAYGVTESNSWRIVTGAVTPFPVRMLQTENLICSGNATREKIEESVLKDILLHTGFRPSFKYKIPVIRDILYKKYTGQER